MRICCVIAALLALSVCAVADDIVTMPTANQLKQGEVDIAAYYIGLDYPVPFPQWIQYQTLYVGITDWLEIDAHHANVDNDKSSTVLVATVKVLSEKKIQPDLVVGCRNIGGTATTSFDLPWTPTINEIEKSKDQSYFVSAAKTFFCNPEKPGPPLFRAHLSYGTPDWTLFGDRRHDGFFGGLQFLFSPTVGMVVQHDGESVITGVTWMPPKSGLTIKGGTYGDHIWVGVAYRKDLF